MTRRLLSSRVAVLALGLGGLVGLALMGGPAVGQFGGPGGGPGGPGMGGMPPMGMMMPPGGGDSGQLAVTDDAVYVLKGHMLYKFDADTLELEAKATLEEFAPHPMPMGGFGGGGFGGGGPGGPPPRPTPEANNE